MKSAARRTVVPAYAAPGADALAQLSGAVSASPSRAAITPSAPTMGADPDSGYRSGNTNHLPASRPAEGRWRNGRPTAPDRLADGQTTRRTSTLYKKRDQVSREPVAPTSGWASSLRLPRDHYVRLDGNDYSVDPAAVGRRVLVTADLEHVVVTLADGRDGARVAHHARCWARHQSITDPAHAVAAARLREAYRRQESAPTETDVAYRDLADHDRLFDLDQASLRWRPRTAHQRRQCWAEHGLGAGLPDPGAEARRPAGRAFPPRAPGPPASRPQEGWDGLTAWSTARNTESPRSTPRTCASATPAALQPPLVDRPRRSMLDRRCRAAHEGRRRPGR